MATEHPDQNPQAPRRSAQDEPETRSSERGSGEGAASALVKLMEQYRRQADHERPR